MIPSHVHTEYSTIDGVATVAELADACERHGFCGCAITDHGVVAGHLDMDKVFRKRGLKPIFGCELYHGVKVGQKLGKERDQSHLIALAMTDEGLRNLWILNDLAAHEDHFHHVGRVTTDELAKYHEGIVFTSACPLGLVPKGLMQGDTSALDTYLNIMGDDFLIALTTYPDAEWHDSEIEDAFQVADLNKRLVNIAEERGLRLIVEDDAHYALPEQYEIHDAYVARNTGQTIFTPQSERDMWHPDGALCIKDEATVRRNLGYLPERAVDEAIATTDYLAERADAHLPGMERHLPVFIPSECPWIEKDKYSDDETDLLFIDLVEEGMYRRYGNNPPERVVEQTLKEAQVFLDPPGDDPDATPLFHYFLLAWDAIQFLEDPSRFFPDEDPTPIERGPGRGSSAGCIVAFELGITDVNPLPYDLIFERFWNPGRASGFPDIDTDIEKGRRAALTKKYFPWRWGEDKVRTIGTVTRMKPKAVVEKMGYACGLTDPEMKELKAIVEQTPDLEILGVDQIGWDRETDPGKVIYVMEAMGDKIVDWIGKQPASRQDVIAKFVDFYARILCNRAANYGVHPSGIVISDVPLADELPCRFASAKDQRIPVTQFPMDDVDKRMFIKFDALGLRTLDVLSEWKQWLKDNHGIDLEWSQLEWEPHPEDMWEQLWHYWAGIFQIERGFPAQLCRDLKPASVADLSIVNALNRPGPIRSGAPASFIRRRAGVEETSYDDPFLEDLLQETYGWFLYQENVIRFFTKLGYSDSDADAVRKILGKKQPEKWAALHDGLEEWAGKSYVEMTAKAGIPTENAAVIWDRLVDFGKYSFNKSHTVAYATLGFRCNFAKYYGPDGFYAACVNNVDKQKKAERIPEFISEARRKGITVHGVDIERSLALVRGIDNEIYFGFNDVKGVSEVGAFFLVKLRDEYRVPHATPEALAQWLHDAGKERSKENSKRKKEGMSPLEGKSPGQMFNAGHIEKLYTAGAWERLEGYPTPLREMQEREKEMLSVIISSNALEAFAANEEAIAECDTYTEALGDYPGEDTYYRLPGYVSKVEEKKTRNGGKRMGIVTIEYEGDQLEFVVFPKEWKAMSFLWREQTPGIFKIRHSLNEKTGKVGYNFDSGELLYDYDED